MAERKTHTPESVAGGKDFLQRTRHPLLTQEQEHDVFSRLRQGYTSKSFLLAPRFISTVAPEDREPFIYIVQSSAGLRDVAAACNQGLVRYVAGRFHRFTRTGLSFEDLTAGGNEGLVRAIDNFDPDRGVKFSTYAFKWIRGTTLDVIRDHFGLAERETDSVPVARQITSAVNAVRKRDPTSRELRNLMVVLTDISPALIDRMMPRYTDKESPFYYHFELYAPSAEDVSLDEMYKEQLRTTFRGALEQLTPFEQYIIRTHFGISGDNPQSLEAIAHQTGRPLHQVEAILEKSYEIMRGLQSVQELTTSVPPPQSELPPQEMPRQQEEAVTPVVAYEMPHEVPLNNPTQTKTENITRILQEGFSNAIEIAQVVGCDPSLVHQIRRRLEKTHEITPRQRTLNPEIDRLLLAGLSVEAVARQLDVPTDLPYRRRGVLVSQGKLRRSPSRQEIREEAKAENPELVEDVKEHLIQHFGDSLLKKGRRDPHVAAFDREVAALRPRTPTEIAGILQVSHSRVVNALERVKKEENPDILF